MHTVMSYERTGQGVKMGGVTPSALKPRGPMRRAMTVLLAAASLGVVAGCGEPGGPGGPCTPATFMAHPPGSTSPCASGETGFFRASVRVGSASGTQKIPLIQCGPDGANYVVVGDGQDDNVLTIRGHSEVFICGYQGPGEYISSGAGGVTVQVKTSAVEPNHRSAADTECTVCVNPDGQSGGYTCRTLRVNGDVAGSTMDATGSFAAAP